MVTYTMLMQLQYWHGRQQARGSNVEGRGAAWHLQVISFLCALAFGIIVPVSRVVLGYHTAEQVIAGSVLGCVVGVVWAAVFHSEAVCLTKSWLESCKLINWFFESDAVAKRKQS
jgi:membrane-associated phospholipid phosphatase